MNAKLLGTPSAHLRFVAMALAVLIGGCASTSKQTVTLAAAQAWAAEQKKAKDAEVAQAKKERARRHQPEDPYAASREAIGEAPAYSAHSDPEIEVPPYGKFKKSVLEKSLHEWEAQQQQQKH